MITVEDKLKSFSDEIIKQVEADSKVKLQEFYDHSKRDIETEKKNILKEAHKKIEDMKLKSEAQKKQIISKASIDKDYELLKKRDEIFQRVFADIKKIAEDYVKSEEYEGFLLNCIDKGLSFVNAKEAVLILTHGDLEKHKEKIVSYLKNKRPDYINIKAEEGEDDMLGGCIVENKMRTLRWDFSIAAMIDNNRELIGKNLDENI
ncbi:V-type proton ATPase subunit E [Oxobacter pfennigii]|uniref:V-type proton ATPase subunit E n=1 Tax=Oxobacter pfennigii TaxID=36849 RepID=A0A0P8YVR0_9CLOT|nr:V-type ATP synthase subunit E [Oxobacter pfennigii]KPU43786.1 V-type proton ATPase subunit E [Oxobacter pfennigii]